MRDVKAPIKNQIHRDIINSPDVAPPPYMPEITESELQSKDEQRRSSSSSNASLAIGLLSLFLLETSMPLGLVLSIIAIIIGVISRHKSHNKTIASIGITLGVITLLYFMYIVYGYYTTPTCCMMYV